MIESKCQRCKVDMLKETPRTRYCLKCKKISNKESSQRYKKSHFPVLIKKCQFCDNVFNAARGRLTCSASCRTQKWDIISTITRREKSIKNKQKQLKELKKKYAHLL